MEKTFSIKTSVCFLLIILFLSSVIIAQRGFQKRNRWQEFSNFCLNKDLNVDSNGAETWISKNRDLLNKLGNKGLSPLHIALGAGNFNITKKLIEAGADPTFPDKNGLTSIVYASLGGNLKCFQIIFNSLFFNNINEANSNKYNLLALACAVGATEEARLLLEHGASPDSTSEFFRGTCLHIAAEEGHIDCVKLLLEYGANIDSSDSIGCTPIFAAKDHPQIVALLIKLGADISVKNDLGQTAKSFIKETLDALIAFNNFNSKNKIYRDPHNTIRIDNLTKSWTLLKEAENITVK